MTRNKFKPIIFTVLALAIISIGVSMFKGSNILFVKYYYYSGYFKQKSGNLDGAIDDFDKAISLDINYPTAYISRGSAYVDLEKYINAISDYSIAIKLSSNDAKPYAYRARAYYEIDSIQRSIQDYNKAIQIDNKFGYAYLNRALLRYTKMDDFSGGCEDLNKAAELGENEAKEHLKNGYCK